tara:strand:+ start:171 stop:431 length:261 start_codon:yes stop_codon:yes gene_type:complete
MVIYIFLAVLLTLTILMCIQESKKRRIGFIPALALCIVLTPLFGYYVISNRPLRTARGCEYCGNSKNEAEYCAVCGKNVEGELKTS